MSHKTVSSLAIAMVLALSLASPALADHVGGSDAEHGKGGSHDNSRGTNAGPGTNSIGEDGSGGDVSSETDDADVDPGKSRGKNNAPGNVKK